MSKQRLHELAGHLQTSVELERAAIAREIHDDVGGSLTAVKFDLAWIDRHAQEPEVRQRVAAASRGGAAVFERIVHSNLVIDFEIARDVDAVREGAGDRERVRRPRHDGVGARA